MHQFTPNFSILPLEQQSLWPFLEPLNALGFALYGGTAIALRLGHRSSVDFDFFTDQPLQQARIIQALPLLAQAQTVQDAPNTWTILVQVPRSPPSLNQVKVSFFGGIHVGRIGEPAATSDGVLVVASLDDLLAHKLKVMLQRVESKDYRDVAALLRHGIALEQGLGGAATLFGPSFQPAESLRALTYFQGGDLTMLDQGDRATLHAAVAAINLGAGLSTVPRLSSSLL